MCCIHDSQLFGATFEFVLSWFNIWPTLFVNINSPSLFIFFFLFTPNFLVEVS
jgi:hypothetical protein